jgi:hypothetical protein
MNGDAVGSTVHLALKGRIERLNERRRRWFNRPFGPKRPF